MYCFSFWQVVLGSVSLMSIGTVMGAFIISILTKSKQAELNANEMSEKMEAVDALF